MYKIFNRDAPKSTQKQAIKYDEAFDLILEYNPNAQHSIKQIEEIKEKDLKKLEIVLLLIFKVMVPSFLIYIILYKSIYININMYK